MKTAIQQAIEELKKHPNEIMPKSKVAYWLENWYIEIEKQQMKDAYEQSKFVPENHTFEDYYNETYKK